MSETRRRGQTRPPRQPDTLTSQAQVAQVPTADVLAQAGQPEAVSNPLEALVSYGETVAEIAATLAISTERIAKAEALERLEMTLQLTAEQLLAWSADLITRWFDVLESDLELDLRLIGLDMQTTASAVTLRAKRDPQLVLQRFREEIQQLLESQGNALDVELRLSIAKTQAIAQTRTVLATRPEYPGSSELLDATKVVVFYQAASLEKLLRLGALPEWEQRGLARTDGRTIILLCDAEGYLAGLAVEVSGARQMEASRWLAFSRAAWRQFQERAAQMRQLHASESNWPGALQVLTPAHLQVATRIPGLERIASQIAETQAALAAAYLASNVTGNLNDELTLRFAGPRPAQCQLSTQPSTEASTSNEDALVRLASWAYAHSSPDKLAMARECLAHELPAGAQVSLDAVEQAAAGALEAAKANFALYLRGNTAQYFTLRQQALDAITQYAANVRKSVSDLTAEVVDNVYRTVGVLVGVVVAALIQPGLAHTVQQIAAFLYTLYLLFIVLYLLRARRQRFDLEATEVQGQLAAMTELSANERRNLLDQANGANQHFEQYYRCSRWIYLALAAAGVLYFLLLLTPLAAHLPLAIPQSTATPLHH